MSGRIQDKVVIITGGASGIGEGMVRRFCAEGAKVILADVNEGAGNTIANACGAQFARHDVSSEDSWKALLQQVETDYGRLDVLLNNAGIISNLTITEVDVASWNQLMAINVTGMMLGCQNAIALMRKSGGGSIVNTASSTSYMAVPDVAYTTSKAAVIGLTKSVAVFCASEGMNIRVNSIHPGATLTNILKTALELTPEIEPNLNRMSPMGRMGTVEEVASMALFLASDEASFCTGGQFPVEGGTVSEHPRM
ncbi:MAG: NAD(P)-dependent dehydrogenase (short-subunit alcohol dehydrogenase family) [Bacteroidia bacterium]|jgi:NAD(P)-dependent dehydrogenase (short-subunit alcohol dehydrogenase family)